MRRMIVVWLVLLAGASCTTHIYIGCLGAVICRPEKPTEGKK
jgi:hypothetical protein